MIEAKNLRKIYKTKKGVVVNALDGVSLKLPNTGMVFLLGKSGSGKSTLLNVLGGLDSLDSGEIIIKGTSAKAFKQRHYDSYRNTYIGFIFQEYNILEELTVGANIALAIELQGRKATNEEINSILSEVDLEGYGQRKPNELSGGQKQRVAIARALVKKPEIIMADEPTGALDSTTGKQVFDTLKKLSKDKLVLIVSHDREFSEQYADRIIELKDGVIISDVEKQSADFAIGENASADEALTFGEGEINIKAGYSLTEEDRILINEYLAAIQSGAVIKTSSAKNEKKNVSEGFVPTDESKIPENKDSNFNLIKSKLSIKNAFKLGSGGLKYKKFRLVFTIFLSVIAFTLFGLADTIAAYDSIKTATNSIYDSGVNYASYVKSIKYGNDDYSYWSTARTLLTLEDIELIKTQTGRDIVGVYKSESQLSYSGNVGYEKPDGMTPSILYMNYFSGITAVDESLISQHGFTLTGRLPEAGKNEIAITKYAYDHFTKVGYKTYTDKGEIEYDILSENDLIGKTLNLDIEYNETNAFTIVGIVDTKFDYSRYEKLADDNASDTMNVIEMMALTMELEAAQNYSFAGIGFVNSSLISDLINSHESRPDQINNANVELYQLVDDSMIVDGEYVYLYGDDKNMSNVISSTYFQSINYFSKIKDSVIWTGDELAKLEDNQIILTYSLFSHVVFGGNGYQPDIFYSPDKLVGFEKTMYDNQKNWEINNVSLSSIFDDPRYYTAIKFAYENRNEAIEVFRDMGWDEDSISNNLSGVALYQQFANLSWQSVEAFDAVITDTRVAEYLNEVVGRYSLSNYVVSDDVKKSLIAEFTYFGNTYKSYDINKINLTFNLYGNVDNIISRKYAAENIEDAIKFYELITGTDFSIFTPSYEEVLNTYSWYLTGNGKDAPEGFVPAASVDYFSYKTALMAKIYKESAADSKIALVADCYSTGIYRAIKDIEVVGVIPDGTGSNYDMINYIVLSDSLTSDIFGPNIGGIYDYAVGVMPSDKSGVNEIVKFSKTYINEEGNVKYQLSNNVTSELDMVDEILEVLGKVFLYVGIGFAVFASLMLTNFIGTSIAHKKQEIGILRAIGSRSNDVFRIFFAESFIIAMINYILALAGTFALTLFINNILRESAGILITFLTFGLRQVGVLLLVSLAVAFIATFLPVKKIAAMKPIDAIKNRK